MSERIGSGAGSGPLDKVIRRVRTEAPRVRESSRSSSPGGAGAPPDQAWAVPGGAETSGFGLPRGAMPGVSAISAEPPSRRDRAGFLIAGEPLTPSARDAAAKIGTAPELGDREFVLHLFDRTTGQAPTPGEVETVMGQLAGGLSRQELIRGFTASPMFQMTQDLREGVPLDPLQTVPVDPAFAAAPIDTSSVEAAVVSAARWAQESSPDLMARINANPPPGKQEEKRLFYELTTKVIGALRAHGLDVARLGRHTQHDVGNPARYVNDAIVLPDGRAIDVFGGDDSRPQFHDLDVKSPKTDRNTGITPHGGRPTSSTSSPDEEVAARAKEARIDRSSVEAAVLSAARWAKATSPDLLARINADPPPDKRQEDRLFYDLMTKVVAALRANLYDVDRLARHTQHAPGNPARYVNDALVLPDGRAIDVFRGGDTEPQFHDLDVPSPKTDRNTGVTPAGRRPSSSTLG
ncbi:MAG: hypothetical protein FJZ01_10175 [Candidatus Sericytochromatia bacterium]|nr:hypothetical protein [Candidatus Tanganyikabacteria bacterium]